MGLDQIGCPLDGFMAEIATKSADHLRAQEQNLLSALHSDPLGLDTSLDPHLLADAHRVGARLLDEVPALSGSLFQPLFVELIRRGQSRCCVGAFVELVADRLFLVSHELANRRHHVLVDDPKDDQEADELSDKC